MSISPINYTIADVRDFLLPIQSLEEAIESHQMATLYLWHTIADTIVKLPTMVKLLMWMTLMTSQAVFELCLMITA